MLKATRYSGLLLITTSWSMYFVQIYLYLNLKEKCNSLNSCVTFDKNAKVK